jgi:acyl-CoA reductase-like NAD-dependent aldehyde dehydrogenase
LSGGTARLLIENVSSAASRNGSWRIRRRAQGLLAGIPGKRVRDRSYCLWGCHFIPDTVIDAAFGEILTTCSKMDWLLRYGEKYLRPETRSSPLLLLYKKSQVHYEPLGVVAAIVSWNYRMSFVSPRRFSTESPSALHNAWSPILAALFTGNAIVIKCSEYVAWSSKWFVDVIKECLRACNFDPELVQVWSSVKTWSLMMNVFLLLINKLVCCFPDQAEALTTSPKIKHITFIGSESVGRQVRPLE